MWRRVAMLCAVVLVAASCGDSSGAADVTVTVIPLPTTTIATATSVTTLPTSDVTLGADPPDEAVASLSGQLFQDPFMGTGFQLMSLYDERGVLVSEASIVGSGPGVDLLGIGPLLPEPIATGLGPDQMLFESWIDNYSGDLVPTAIVLYSRTADGWVATAVIDSASVEAALLLTTDYAAAAPAGPVAIQMSLSEFDWTVRLFRAGVSAFDYFEEFELVYEGEIECTIGTPLECTTLSDDGVLRPGDEGEDVEALQNDLAALGYLIETIDGKYGPQMSAAVSAFQADYGLTADGKAGPNTLGLMADIAGGASGLILASRDRIGDVVFGTPADAANGDLFVIFGPPDTSTGWYEDACDGYDWLQARWDGFSVIFTDREGFRQLDGWAVNDLSDLPSGLVIAGGIQSSWTWSDFDAAGAEFDPGHGGFFHMVDLAYSNGRFVDSPSDPPVPDAAVSGLGAGTGAFVGC